MCGRSEAKVWYASIQHSPLLISHIFNFEWQGMEDKAVPPAMTDYIARVLPQATIHRLPNEGHFSYLFFCDGCHRRIFSTLFGAPQGPIDKTVEEEDSTERPSPTETSSSTQQEWDTDTWKIQNKAAFLMVGYVYIITWRDPLLTRWQESRVSELFRWRDHDRYFDDKLICLYIYVLNVDDTMFKFTQKWTLLRQFSL